jgi:hypothetical protein
MTKKNASLGKRAVTQKEFILMNRTCSGITGVIKSLRSSLSDLDKGMEKVGEPRTPSATPSLLLGAALCAPTEIKADEKGKFDFDKELTKLEVRKETIRKRMAANKAWAHKYDTELGPFMGTYVTPGQSLDGMLWMVL